MLFQVKVKNLKNKTLDQQEVEGQNTAVSILKNDPSRDNLQSDLIQDEEGENEEESTNHNYLFYFKK